jgi:TetR/AcrR family tetracycline transcriptional repressor
VALRLADERGLDALSMRAIAAELEVYPATVQWHVGTKAELLASVSAMIFDELVLPDEHELGWAEWLSAVAHEWRAVLHRHPNVAAVVGAHMVIKSAMLPVIERIVGVFQRAGFAGTDLVDAYNTFMGFLSGWVTMELSTEPASQDSGFRDEYAQALRSLSPHAFPALTRSMDVLENNAFMTRYDSGRRRPMDRSFAVAVRVVLHGLQDELGQFAAHSTGLQRAPPNVTPDGRQPARAITPDLPGDDRSRHE